MGGGEGYQKTAREDKLTPMEKTKNQRLKNRTVTIRWITIQGGERRQRGRGFVPWGLGVSNVNGKKTAKSTDGDITFFNHSARFTTSDGLRRPLGGRVEKKRTDAWS